MINSVNHPNFNTNLGPGEPRATSEVNPDSTMPRSKKAVKHAEVIYAPQEREPKTRNRPIKACFPCRNSKGKCDQVRPRCSRCEEHNFQCKYLPTKLSPEQLAVLNELKQTDRNIQKQRTVVAIGNPSRKIEQGARESSSSNARDSHSDGWVSGADEQSFVQLNDNPVNVASVGNDPLDEDLMLDMGFKVGKISINDRIGAYQRSTVDQELDVVLNSPLFDHRTPEEKAECPSIPQVAEFYEPIPSDTAYRFHPGNTYVAPISGFPFSANPIHTFRKPTRKLADLLMAQYWKCVHPVARTIHKPSFERVYRLFWEGRHTPTSAQALIFAAMFSAVVSMSRDHQTLHQLRGEHINLLEILQSSTEALLGRAHLARTTRLETIQAAVTYLIPLCRADVGRVHSTAVASAVRIAQCMDLHKDSTECDYDPVTTHVRRMVWHELLLLDTRAYEAHGPQLLIREESYTTRFPLNVDDHDLNQSVPPCEDSGSWTDMTLTRIRMECDKVIRRIYLDRDRIGSGDGQISLADVLHYISQFRKSMKQRFGHMFDDKNPLQHYGRLIIELHTRRMYAMILHHYHGMSGTERMPDRLNERLMESGIANMAIAKEIETSEALKPWLWYAGALHQHHYALLMLVEFFMHPYRKSAALAWDYLDWVFEVPPEQAHDPQKARRLLTKVRNEMRAYLTAKRLRGSNHMRVSSTEHKQGAAGFLLPVKTGAGYRINIKPGKHANNARPAPRSRPSHNICVTQIGNHQSLNADQARGPEPWPPGKLVSVYGSSSDWMEGVETADPGRSFDQEWQKYEDTYPPNDQTGDLNGAIYEYKPSTYPVSFDEQGQLQAITSMYPGFEVPDAFGCQSQAYTNGYPYPPGTHHGAGISGPTSVSMESPAIMNSGFTTSGDNPSFINDTIEDDFYPNGHQMVSVNSFGSDDSSRTNYSPNYRRETICPGSRNYNNNPVYHNYEEANGTIASGRIISDVPHRPMSGRSERLSSGITKKRKQPGLGRGSR